MTGWQDVDWGSAPTWVSAAITSGSFLVAATAYRRSVLEKERDQASKVAAWVALEEDAGTRKRVLRLRNSSDGPIFEVTVELAGKPVVESPELVPETTSTFDLPDDGSDYPASVQKVTVEVQSIFTVGLSRETLLTGPTPTMTFRDSTGRWWERDRQGRLRRLKNRVTAHVYGLRYGPLTISWQPAEQLTGHELRIGTLWPWPVRKSKRDLKSRPKPLSDGVAGDATAAGEGKRPE
ncbi:hypothetical protein [Symbioplanes lichenis]|uniref:hypothetical protein n=1 Tax=Symbioplanes lichenis TaxID=1629072 RepID=UPI002738AEDF|nr:hypothetical protein [Actinoplanes lichenis]